MDDLALALACCSAALDGWRASLNGRLTAVQNSSSSDKATLGCDVWDRLSGDGAVCTGHLDANQ